MCTQQSVDKNVGYKSIVLGIRKIFFSFLRIQMGRIWLEYNGDIASLTKLDFSIREM